MTEVAVFQIANEEFAIGIEDVQEIIKYTQITPIPEAPQFVDGVINLRGVVIPIVSLPERLGFEKNIDSKSKILVCIINEERVGLLVDDVNEIMFIEDKFISKSDKEDALFSDIITLDEGKRIILKLQVSNILEDNILNNIKVS
jgi:purine-binding chemotaxis protein CheW